MKFLSSPSRFGCPLARRCSLCSEYISSSSTPFGFGMHTFLWEPYFLLLCWLPPASQLSIDAEANTLLHRYNATVNLFFNLSEDQELWWSGPWVYNMHLLGDDKIWSSSSKHLYSKKCHIFSMVTASSQFRLLDSHIWIHTLHGLQLTKYESMVEVKRDGTWSNLDFRMLVPGDLVRVKSNWHLPCDLLIKQGASISTSSWIFVLSSTQNLTDSLDESWASPDFVMVNKSACLLIS